MITSEPLSPLREIIAGIAVKELAEQFGTPTYVYDASKILARIEDLRAFDVIRYAQKACSNLAILDLVRRQGVLVDAVSAGEIHRALSAGFPAAGNPAPIVYTADILDRESLALHPNLTLRNRRAIHRDVEELSRRTIELEQRSDAELEKTPQVDVDGSERNFDSELGLREVIEAEERRATRSAALELGKRGRSASRRRHDSPVIERGTP